MANLLYGQVVSDAVSRGKRAFNVIGNTTMAPLGTGPVTLINKSTLVAGDIARFTENQRNARGNAFLCGESRWSNETTVVGD